MSFNEVFNEQIKNFPPPYFSLVMATAILAIGAELLKWDLLSDSVLVLAILLYALLLFVYIFRSIKFWKKVKMDLKMHMKGPGFLTFVIATAVLGIGFELIWKANVAAQILFGVAMFSWVIILFTLLLGTSLKPKKPPLVKTISGSWLLVVVSIQSLVILTGFVEKKLSSFPWLLEFSLLLWLLGALMYIVFVTLVLYRLIFLPVRPDKISPSFWLDAGAAASLTFAGVSILNSAPAGHTIAGYAPVIKVLALLGWVAASWWLILLVLQETWRHLKVGFSYSVGYWSLVFPLGIYAIASKRSAEVFKFPVLKDIGNIFVYLTLILWVLIFIWMIIHLIKIYKPSPTD